MDFPGVAAPYSVVQNDCRPNQPDDPGFALLTQDAWYIANPQYAGMSAQYGNDHAKRSQQWFNPEEIVVVDVNTTRKATEQELKDELGLRKCSDTSCAKEMKELGIESAQVFAPPVATPVVASTAHATAGESDASSPTLASTGAGSGSPAETASGSESEHVGSASGPRETGSLLKQGLKELLAKL